MGAEGGACPAPVSGSFSHSLDDEASGKTNEDDAHPKNAEVTRYWHGLGRHIAGERLRTGQKGCGADYQCSEFSHCDAPVGGSYFVQGYHASVGPY